jgi:hypothetical protein
MKYQTSRKERTYTVYDIMVAHAFDERRGELGVPSQGDPGATHQAAVRELVALYTNHGMIRIAGGRDHASRAPYGNVHQVYLWAAGDARRALDFARHQESQRHERALERMVREDSQTGLISGGLCHF